MAFDGAREALGQAQEYAQNAGDFALQYAIYLGTALLGVLGLAVGHRGTTELVGGAQKAAKRITG